MKIQRTDIDETQFMIHSHIINGEECFLVQPNHIGAKFTQKNKIFRSSVWNSDWELISASFPKFVNWGENPENFPTPDSVKNCTIVEKLDGSTLIVSKYKGELIIRTRGTVDATRLDNGHEIEIFKSEVLPLVGEIEPNRSYIFEWTSPLNKIILNYGDTPKFSLIGLVFHTDYHLATQGELDTFAKNHGLLRPTTYIFNDLNEVLAKVDQWKGKEGVCIYSKKGQEIHKCKSAEYLAKHRFKSEATLENTLDLYFSMDKPSYKNFETQLIATFDYECFEMVRGFISIICDAQVEVQHIINGFDSFVENTLKQLPTRKDQAQRILASYGQTNRASFIFTRLDGKSLSDDQIKKLFWQVLKK